MKTLLFFTCIALMLAQFGHAGEAVEIEDPKSFLDVESVVVTTDVNRFYYFDDAIFAPGAVVWINHTTTFESGMWVNFFLSQGLEEGILFDDEYDVVLGWTGNVGPFGLELAGLYIDAEPLLGQYADDFLLARVKVRKDIALADNVNLWGRWTFRHVFQGTVEGGHLGDAGIDLNIPLGDRLFATVSPQVLYNDGHFGVDPGLSAIVDARLTHQLGPGRSCYVGGRFFSPLFGREDAETTWVWMFGARIELDRLRLFPSF